MNLVVHPGKSLCVLARVLIASEQPQRRVREFTCNGMWEAEVKGFVKEIICKHHADGHLVLHLLCLVFAGATDRHFSCQIAISGCRQDALLMGNHLSLGLQAGRLETERFSPQNKLLGPGQFFVGQWRESATK